MADAEKLDPLIGSTFANNYEILSLLGQGGMSAVYKARQPLINRVVAIKMLLSQQSLSQQSLQRFRQEAEAASALSHPNVITVYEFGITQDPVPRPYLVIEFLDGKTLAEIIRQDGPLEAGRSIKIFTRACTALAEAHNKGIIHRDLKPSNLMLIDRDGDPDFLKILDFGIAKLLPGEGEDLVKLTQTGELLGSPAYMSPEQCRGERLDIRTDIYSLGCMMYETLTGRSPFQGVHPYDVLLKHTNEMPGGFGTISANSPVTAELEAIVFKAIAKDPVQRYQSMSELQEELQRASKTGQSGLLSQLARRWKVLNRQRAPWKPSRTMVIGLAVVLLFLTPVALWAVFSLYAPNAIPRQEVSWQAKEPQPPAATTAILNNLETNKALLRTRPSGIKKSDLLLRIGAAYENYGLYDRAAGVYLQAETSLKDSEGTDYVGLPPVMTKRADCYYRMNSYQEAGSLYEEAVKLVRLLGDSNNEQLPPLLARLGDIYLSKNHFKEAREAYQQSLKAAQNTVLRDVPEYALTKSKIADAFRLEADAALAAKIPDEAHRDYEQAVDCYLDAISEWVKFADKQERGLAVSFYHLASVYQKLGQWSEAAKYYKQSSYTFEKVLDADDPFKPTLLSDYADALWHTGNWMESLEKSKEARVLMARRK